MSAHLLMLSGIGPKDHLTDLEISPVWVDLQVGTSYQNRPAINLQYAITDQSLVGKLPMNTDNQIEDCVVNGNGPMCDRILVLYNSKINYPKEFVDIINFITLSPPVAGSNVSVGHAFTFIAKTRAMGTIRLRSNNYRDLPYVDPNVLGHPEDRTRMMDAIAKFFYHLEETSFKKYASIPEKPHSSECEYCKSGPQWKCPELHECLFRTLGITEFHPLGVLPFGGPNRIEAVLDERLRVRGVGGLRVADASVLPVGYTFTPNTGPAYVVMMVAEKAADMITEDNKN
ncbi:choline oxidase-like [Oppia nitens]|uniref:choline oxidase-like n=1 Tax=Oppia nitens TaxID=1686743 RepID=UPI0023DC9398|nr:choline oxidase-like [Oppia nitens]